jgi:hypothetical protein
MQGIFIGIFMMAGMMAINLLPIQPGWRILIAGIFGGAVGWGIMRWKNR